MEKINNKQAISLIITLILNNIILVCSQEVIETCSSSSLLNALYISIVAIFITWIITALFKKFAGQDILDISEFLGGTVLKCVVGIIFLAYFLFTISILLRRLTNCLQIINYKYTNIVFIILLFLIASGIICNFKNKCIPKAVSIFLPIALSSIILIFIGNFRNFDFNAIYPILGNGTQSTFLSGLSNLYAFSGIAYLYFLPPDLKNPDKFKKISLTAMIISAVLLILSVANILFLSDNILTSSELFPSYLAVRYIEFGSFFQRLDSVFLLIWNISFISVLAIITDICINIFKKITQISDTKPIICPMLLTIFGIAMLINNNSILKYLESDVSKILFFGIVIGLGLLILLIANIKFKRKEIKNE